jgi:hypothetical protein
MSGNSKDMEQRSMEFNSVVAILSLSFFVALFVYAGNAVLQMYFFGGLLSISCISFIERSRRQSRRNADLLVAFLAISLFLVGGAYLLYHRWAEFIVPSFYSADKLIANLAIPIGFPLIFSVWALIRKGRGRSGGMTPNPPGSPDGEGPTGASADRETQQPED